jgi:hypothetical protein
MIWLPQFALELVFSFTGQALDVLLGSIVIAE